jgi:hypothetical protein
MKALIVALMLALTAGAITVSASSNVEARYGCRYC